MGFIFQFGIILAVSLTAEALHALIPLPIPASIYGLLLMLLCLKLRIIRLDQVEGAGEFLLKLLPLLFVPAVVGLMASWDALLSMLLPAAAAVLIVTPLVMASSGLAAQTVLRREKKR
jgi:holin-like protein